MRPVTIRSKDEACVAVRPHTADLASIVDDLCAGDHAIWRKEQHSPCAEPLPSSDIVVEVVENLRSILFPGYFGPHEPTSESLRFHLGHTLDMVRRTLRAQVKRGICFACEATTQQPDCNDKAHAITEAFLACIPKIQQGLIEDAQAAYEGDPAATSADEAIFSYPGLRAITDYRIAHELHLLGVPILPRMITEYAHRSTGIDIHPGASIGRRFFIDHGTGVVLGETCIIGDRVRVYQGVTLGAKSFPLDENGRPIKGVARHPIIENDVIIYSGATILGRVTIGAGSVIGGNIWLTRSVPPGSRLTQQQPRQETFQDGGGI